MDQNWIALLGLVAIVIGIVFLVLRRRKRRP